MPSYQPVMHFIGREEERAFLQDNLRPGRIVTLCGPGGIGKTALMRWAINDPQIKSRFPDGIFIHPFYEETLAEQAFGAIARHCGLDPRPDARAAAAHALAERQLLLVLDGAEAADDLRAVVQVRGAKCGLLITSQNRAHRWDKRLDIDTLSPDKSQDLLEYWAGGKRMDEAEAAAIRQAVGDLPLALRLVGSYLDATSTSPTEYLQLPEIEQLQRLDQDEKDFNVGSVLTVLARTLTRVTPTAKEVCAVLGILAQAPFRADEITAALGVEVAEALGQLVQFSLLAREEDGGYSVSHALVHRYARQFLKVPPETVARLATYYTQLAKHESERGLAGYHELDKVRHHLLACLEACAGIEAWREMVALVWAVDNYLDIRGYWRERQAALTQGIAAAQQVGQRYYEYTLLMHLGITHKSIGQLKSASDYYQQALTASHKAGDKRTEGKVLGNLGNAYEGLGEIGEASTCHEQAVVIAREIGDKWMESVALGNLGNAYYSLGEMKTAISRYQQALVIAHEIDDKRNEGNQLGNLGNAYYSLGEMKIAIIHYQQALVIAREIGDKRMEGTALGNLGNAYKAKGEIEKAKRNYDQALAITDAIGDYRGASSHAWNLGLLLVGDDPAQAITLMSRLVAYLEAISHPDAAAHAEDVAAIRRRLDEQDPS